MLNIKYILCLVKYCIKMRKILYKKYVLGNMYYVENIFNERS